MRSGSFLILLLFLLHHSFAGALDFRHCLGRIRARFVYPFSRIYEPVAPSIFWKASPLWGQRTLTGNYAHATFQPSGGLSFSIAGPVVNHYQAGFDVLNPVTQEVVSLNANYGEFISAEAQRTRLNWKDVAGYAGLGLYRENFSAESQGQLAVLTLYGDRGVSNRSLFGVLCRVQTAPDQFHWEVKGVRNRHIAIYPDDYGKIFLAPFSVRAFDELLEFWGLSEAEVEELKQAC